MMAPLRLAKLADRAPVKVTIAIPHTLNPALANYPALYASTYERDESVPELTPAMVAAFLESDKAFARWCKEEDVRRG
jgi:hypothetical protein